MNTYGDKTRPTVVLTHESHKLHKEFTAGAKIGRSQAVKLNATGLAVPMAAGDNRNLCIGISIHGAAASGENVTVVCKPFLTLLCRATAEITPGPVKLAGYYSEPDLYNSATIGQKGPAWGVNTVAPGAATGADADFFGIAIEGGDADTFVEVIVFS